MIWLCHNAGEMNPPRKWNFDESLLTMKWKGKWLYASKELASQSKYYEHLLRHTNQDNGSVISKLLLSEKG